MSAGSFSRSKYQSAITANIYGVRVQPETLALQIGSGTNTPPAGDINQSSRASVVGGRRNRGVNCRKVRFTFADGATPTGYKVGSVLTLPIMTQSFFDTILPDQTGSYLGAAIVVIGTTPEYRN